MSFRVGFCSNSIEVLTRMEGGNIVGVGYLGWSQLHGLILGFSFGLGLLLTFSRERRLKRRKIVVLSQINMHRCTKRRKRRKATIFSTLGFTKECSHSQ